MEGARFCMVCGNAVSGTVYAPVATNQTPNTKTTAMTARKYPVSSLLLRILLLMMIAIPIVLMATGVISTGPKPAIIGRWQADLGYIPLWGNVTENLEFFPDGSVTLNREIAVFTGNYEWLNDQKLRIEWTEQGIFGHSSSEVWHIELIGDRLEVSTSTGRVTTYWRVPWR